MNSAPYEILYNRSSGMNFDQAISAHVQWKSKLAAYIAKPDHSLHAEIIAKDDQCELGKWIHGEEGRNLPRCPTFRNLWLTTHALSCRRSGCGEKGRCRPESQRRGSPGREELLRRSLEFRGDGVDAHEDRSLTAGENRENWEFALAALLSRVRLSRVGSSRVRRCGHSFSCRANP